MLNDPMRDTATLLLLSGDNQELLAITLLLAGRT